MSFRRLSFPSALLVACASACSSESREPVTRFQLLARTPDLLLDQPGVLVPDPKTQWGAFGQAGWALVPYEIEHEGRRLCAVWSRETRATLRLPAVSARDRTLVLTLFGPGVGPTTVEVSLNGVALGKLALGPRPSEQRLAAPAALWHPGENQLEFESALTPLPKGTHKVGFALARVEYDASRSIGVDTHERRVSLQSGTSVGYRIEPLAPAELVLAGRARGRGKVALSLARIAPGTEQERTGLQALELPLADQELSRSFELPQGGTLELEIAWQGDADSELVLERLQLQEFTPVQRPPILLISIDTLSARHLSLQGYPLPTTPALEHFVRDAIVFEQ